MRLRHFVGLGVILCAATTAFGVSYDEGVDGDLSGSRLAPTSLGVMGIGSHTLAGHTVSGDLDYFTLNVPAGAQLSAMNLTSFVSTDDIAFIAIQAGTVFTEPPSGTVVGNLLGYTHFGTALGTAQPGSDMLDNFAAGAGAIGFVPPLPAGDYVFWCQQANAQGVDYEFEFVVTSSLPPAAWDEGVDGDFSGDRLAPTGVGSLGVGTHTVRGSTTAGDLDYWTITIPPGAQLSQMIETGFVSTDDVGFIGIQAGAVFTEPAGSPNVANILGYVHFSIALVGFDVLPIMGNSSAGGAIGFTPPLPAGVYTFWLQQEHPQPIDYEFDLVVTSAPPPPGCTGDVNNDGFTNSADFNILAGNFGSSVTPNTNGDLTGDGLVNSADFNVLAGDFGCAP